MELIHKNINTIIRNIIKCTTESTKNKNKIRKIWLMFDSTHMSQSGIQYFKAIDLKTLMTNKRTKTPALTPLTDIQHETHKENPIFIFATWRQNKISSAVYSEQKHHPATYKVFNFTCAPPSWFHIEIIPGLYILTPRRMSDPSFKAAQPF